MSEQAAPVTGFAEQDAADKRLIRRTLTAFGLGVMGVVLAAGASVPDAYVAELRVTAADALHHKLGLASEQEQAIGIAVRTVVGGNPLTRCADIRDRRYDGVAYKKDTSYIDSARVRPRICDGFMAAKDLREAPKDDVQADAVAWGLYVVAHETAHTTRGAGEAEASCVGIQWVDDLAIVMGASEYAAHQLQGRAKEIANRPGTDPDYLPTPDCRKGGTWDVRPNDSTDAREFPGVPALAGK